MHKHLVQNEYSEAMYNNTKHKWEAEGEKMRKVEGVKTSERGAYEKGGKQMNERGLSLTSSGSELPCMVAL